MELPRKRTSGTWIPLNPVRDRSVGAFCAGLALLPLTAKIAVRMLFSFEFLFWVQVHQSGVARIGFGVRVVAECQQFISGALNLAPGRSLSGGIKRVHFVACILIRVMLNGCA